MRLGVRRPKAATLRVGLAASIASGAGAALIAFARRRARRRASAGNAAFARASAGLWPNQASPAGPLTVHAPRATSVDEPPGEPAS